MCTSILPHIIIKKVLKYLKDDCCNFKLYLLISKEFRTYFYYQIDRVLFVNKDQYNKILQVKLGNGEWLKDKIRKLTLDTKILYRDQISVKELKVFGSLVQVTINLIQVFQNSDRYYRQVYEINKSFNTKYISSTRMFLFHDDGFDKVKKLKILSCELSIQNVCDIMEGAPNLKSFDSAIMAYNLFEQSGSTCFERFSNSLINCKHLKKLSFRDIGFNKSNMKGLSAVEIRYNQFIDTLNNTLVFLNISKLHLYNVPIKRIQFFDSLSKSMQIQKLKLVSTNLGDEDIFNEFINYISNENCKLVKLSIRGNKIGGVNQNQLFKKYINQTKILSKLDLSYNLLNLNDIFMEISTYHINQYSQITISDNPFLSFDLLFSSNITNHMNIKYKYNHNGKELSKFLNPSNISQISSHFNSDGGDFFETKFLKI